MAQARRQRPTETTRSVTTGTVVRIETPKSNRQKEPAVVKIVAQEINPVGGFINFLRDYAVVGLAVGFVIGLQAQTLVKQLVTSFIDPSFQLLFGQALQTRKHLVHLNGHEQYFYWGAFVYALLDFLFVLAAVYAIVKIFNLDKLDRKKKA